MESEVYLPREWTEAPARQKKLHSRRGRVPSQAAERFGNDRSCLEPRRARAGLDVRRIVRPRQRLSGRPRTAWPGICGRSADPFPWLGDAAAGAPGRPVAAPGPQEKVSTTGASPAIERSAKPGALCARLPATNLAALPHQGHAAWARSLGDKMGGLLAEGQ